MKITVLNKQNEIGGNKVLVEHKDTRILLDFGMSFDQLNKYFAEFIQPRKALGLKDFLTMGLLPDMKGIYREDYVQHTGREKEERSVDAVFITHAHADHSMYLHFLRWDIPVYCTKGTKLVLETMQTTGGGAFNDLVNVTETYLFKEGKNGDMVRVRRDEWAKHEREFHLMGANEKVKIGSLEIECCPVDHSLPGACAYIIYSDEGTLVYSGDIRFHGYSQDSSQAFIEKARSVNPDWLLVEGTRIKSLRKDSEEWVEESMDDIIRETKGLVLVEHPMRDLDRIYSVYLAAKKHNRRYAVSMKIAFFLEILGDLSPMKVADVDIFVPLKGWGLIEKEEHDDAQKMMDYWGWERDYINRPNSVTPKDIRENQSKYVLSTNLWQAKHLIDIQPEEAVWIKSTVMPFNIEMELNEKLKQNWLDHFGIKQLHAHASGHASRTEMKDMIARINAKEVIPIHTEFPEEL